MPQTLPFQDVLIKITAVAARVLVKFQQIRRATTLDQVLFWLQKAIWVGISFGIANLAVIAVNQHLLDAPTNTVQKATHGGPASRASLNPSLIATIHNNNVFGVEVGGVKPLKTGQVVRQSTTPLNTLASTWSLKGVFQGEQDYAIILDIPAKKEDVFGLGEELFQKGAYIEEIKIGEDVSKVIIRSGADKITLELKDENAVLEQPTANSSSAPAGQKKGKTKARNAKIRQKGNQFYLTSQEVEAQLANFSQLLSQARVIPNMKDGVADGYKIDAIDKGSLFEKLGLKNNDQIFGVNGQKIDSVEKAFSLLTLFRNEKEINLSIQRKGKAKTLTYHIQ